MWSLSLLDIGLTAGALITLITVLMSCVCGCKKKNPKSELVGTAGVVTLRCEEDRQSPDHSTPESIKRASGQNSQRSLPEIPHVVVRHESGDTASDIYATVGVDQNAGVEVLAPVNESEHRYEHAYAKLHDELDLFTEVRSNAPKISSPASSFAPGPSLESQLNVSEAPISACVAMSGQLPSSLELPYITPRPPSPGVLGVSAEPSASAPHAPEPHYFSGDSTDSTKGYTSISVREPLSQIRAATSQLTKNDTLHAARPHATHPHYASVSDDSDEMYAAIDEPLQAVYSAGPPSETYAQIQPLTQQDQPHTADDVDTDRRRMTESAVTPEVAIPTPTLHSRQASMSSTKNMAGVLGSPKPEKRQANSPLPPPPASHTPHAPHSLLHNDKGDDSPQHGALVLRQHRISSISDLNTSYDRSRRSFNEKHERNNSCVSSSDFYGCNYHVDTQRFSSGDLSTTSSRHLVVKELDFGVKTLFSTEDTQLYNSIDKPGNLPSAENEDSLLCESRLGDTPHVNVEEMYAKVVKKGKAHSSMPDRDGTNHLKHDNLDYFIKPLDSFVSMSNKIGLHNFCQESTLDVALNELLAKLPSSKNEDSGYETIDQKCSHEIVTDKKKTLVPTDPQDPGYETVGNLNRSGAVARTLQQDKILEKLKRIDSFLDSGPESIPGSDPGYERIRRKEIVQSDSDPNYEVLRPQPSPPLTPPYATIASAHCPSRAQYSVVDKKHKKYQNNVDPCDSECNYESMPHDLLYTTSSESDSNYESVRPKNANYESVKHERLSEDPPYERVLDHGAPATLDRSDLGAGYEKLNPVNKPEAPHNRLSTTADLENRVDDYFQV